MVSPQWRRDGSLADTPAQTWAAELGTVILALATRRAADLSEALGCSESAAFFRKVLD